MVYTLELASPELDQVPERVEGSKSAKVEELKRARGDEPEGEG